MTEKHSGPPVPIPFGDSEPKRNLGRKKQAVDWLIMNGEISAVYPHAIEVPGFVFGTSKGMMTLGGLIALVGASFALFIGTWRMIAGNGEEIFSALAIIVGIVFLGISVAFIRLDIFSYRDEPVLFNRVTRKVHVFRRRVEMKRPWRPWPVVIDTYDWDCILGEVHGGFQLAGGSLPAMRFQLVAGVYDGPTGRGRKVKLIDRFVIGAEMSSEQFCVARWEHIRRYMEEDGPALQAGETLSKTSFSHREALARVLWVLEPGYYKDFRDKPGSKIVSTLVFVLLLPFGVFLALFRWLAEVTSRDPWWTPEMLEAAGGAPLPDAEVYARAAEDAKSSPQEIAPDEAS